MNQKQALRAASKHIEELEDFNRRASADIRAYNFVILGMIAGENPCDWCEECNECQLQAKGKGCSEWWLRNDSAEQITASGVKEDEDSDSKRIYGASPESPERT